MATTNQHFEARLDDPRSLVKKPVERLADATRNAIVAHPITAAAIAFGFGYLVVRAVRR